MITSLEFKIHFKLDFFFSAAQTVETLASIAIQAYAELNRWQEVIPFVAQIYNGIEECPLFVVKLW